MNCNLIFYNVVLQDTRTHTTNKQTKHFNARVNTIIIKKASGGGGQTKFILLTTFVQPNCQIKAFADAKIQMKSCIFRMMFVGSYSQFCTLHHYR